MSLCRICSAELRHTFCDLGMAPLSNAFVSDPGAEERVYPLHARVCSECLLVQLDEFETPQEIFSDYAYFSSYSDTWLRHAEAYAKAMLARLRLGPQSRVVEIASNDGYLLQYFRREGIPVLGIEPAANVASAAEARGIETLVEFFDARLAGRLEMQGVHADLVVANNVLAHVPALNDFVDGVRILLAREGTATFEFPHLLRLMLENQFDTIYHEHFSYFSLMTVERLFASHGLLVFDVEELPTHGGSLRIYVCHRGSAARPISSAVDAVRSAEREAGLASVSTYAAFQGRAEAAKAGLLRFLEDARRGGKRTAAYGAAAKGNTLLNYCGIHSDSIEFVADRSPHKQGRFMPGSHIPIAPPDRIREARPDYLLILPWNLKEEVVEQNSYIRDWGGRFVVPIPRVEVLQ